LDIGHIPTGKRRLDTVLLDIPECYDGCLDARLTLNDTFMTYDFCKIVAWETWAIWLEIEHVAFWAFIITIAALAFCFTLLATYCY